MTLLESNYGLVFISLSLFHFTVMPKRPIISKMTTESTTGTIRWVQPRGGDVPILRYEVMYKPREDLRFTFTQGPVVDKDSRTAVVTGLKPYTEYHIYVAPALPKQLEESVVTEKDQIRSPLYRVQTDVDGRLYYFL